jgi:hypothetical protein
VLVSEAEVTVARLVSMSVPVTVVCSVSSGWEELPWMELDMLLGEVSVPADPAVVSSPLKMLEEPAEVVASAPVGVAVDENS